MRPAYSRLGLLSFAGVSLLILLAIVMFLVFNTSARAGHGNINVGAGVGSGTVAGNVYAPGDIAVHVGDKVTWTIESDEPHSITFGSNPGGGPPPSWPVTGYTPPPPGPPGPVNLGTATHDGNPATFINTGLRFGDSTAAVQFNGAGSFNFFCVIHPGMAGNVNVVALDQDATTQAEADAAAAQTESLILGQVAGLSSQTQATVTSEPQANGTTLWKIFTNGVNAPAPMPGGGTGYLELLEFIPPNLAVKAGDSVLWQATAPHTVTFLPPGQSPGALGDPFGVPAAKPSEGYDGQSLYNSGPLAFGPPGGPKTFQLTFPNAGTFPYLCLIHVSLGQTGTVAVGPASLPTTGSTRSSGDSGPQLALWAALIAGGAAACMLAIAGRRLLR